MPDAHKTGDPDKWVQKRKLIYCSHLNCTLSRKACRARTKEITYCIECLRLRKSTQARSTQAVIRARKRKESQ